MPINTRDYFAGLAMQAMLGQILCYPSKIPADAYRIADAMMAERNKKHSVVDSVLDKSLSDVTGYELEGK